jgi:micrococcal nuclease
VIIETIKDKREKYGRYLALIYIKIDQSLIVGLSDIRTIGDFYCLNDILIAKGLARKYML